ncbi:hypothetical protein J6590_061697 [Homalodisca vitripennis]|nr:hypothetical protein J6590_061697 [Homalodisca vitripennis]
MILSLVSGLGVRHYQAVMTFLSMVLSYSMRVSLSVGIVAMTDTKGSDPDIMVLDWDFAQKGIILSSFYWGYMVTQIPAGHLSRKFGPKYLLLSAMLVCSATTLLSPIIAVNCHWVIFCLSRVIQGLSQGFFFPSVNTHIAKWAPPGEKTRIFSFVFGGK